jgi:hypothetical protein
MYLVPSVVRRANERPDLLIPDRGMTENVGQQLQHQCLS